MVALDLIRRLLQSQKRKLLKKRRIKRKIKKDEKKDEQQDTAKNEFEEVAEKAIKADEVDRVKSVAFLDEFDKKKDKKAYNR